MYPTVQCIRNAMFNYFWGMWLKTVKCLIFDGTLLLLFFLFIFIESVVLSWQWGRIRNNFHRLSWGAEAPRNRGYAICFRFLTLGRNLVGCWPRAGGPCLGDGRVMFTVSAWCVRGSDGGPVTVAWAGAENWCDATSHYTASTKFGFAVMDCSRNMLSCFFE